MSYNAAVNSRGVVLCKHFPRACMISLLDEQHGHIKAVSCSWQWASSAVPGALIAYEIDSRAGMLFINQLELCGMPACSNQQALAFLHHVLELCAICLPVHGGHHETFELVLEIIAALDVLANDTLGQRLALAKLLFASGQYPAGVDRLSVSGVLHKTYAQLKEVMFNEIQQRELALFIYHCLAHHPAGKQLKTINFFPWDKP